MSDENDLSFWRPSWTDKRLLRSRHIVFHLSRPAKSLALLAPLAASAGGYGLCVATPTATPPFATTADPDNQRILAMVTRGQARLDEIKRFDMPGFRPDPAYVREMKRYGVLPATLDPAKDAIDVYATDRTYWRSLWWRPSNAPE